MSLELTWLGHASFRIVVDTDFVIYIDPWDIDTDMTADLVLITHSHYDHLSPKDVDKVRGETTQVLIPPDGANKLPGPVTEVHRGGIYHVGPVEVHAVAAYSVGKSFHPDSEGWVGYRIMAGGTTIYHAGDTDLIPEMAKIQADVALLPIGGTYTMDVEEALRAVSMIKPRIAVPMHFGRIVGSPEDAARFAQQAPEGIEIRVLSEGETTSLS